jgi:GNAT superfamily N-acetyltransferase
MLSFKEFMKESNNLISWHEDSHNKGGYSNSDNILESNNIDSFQNSIISKYKDKGLTNFSIFLDNDFIKLNMISIDKKFQKQGIGSEVLEDLCKFADDNKKTLILTTGTKDDNFGTTSMERLKKFYKRFDFIENKGRNKDFSISGNMYRLFK